MTSCGDNWQANMYYDGDGDYYFDNFTGEANQTYSFKACVYNDNKRSTELEFTMFQYFTDYQIEKFIVGNTTLQQGTESETGKFWWVAEDNCWAAKLDSVPAVNTRIEVVAKLNSDKTTSDDVCIQFVNY